MTRVRRLLLLVAIAVLMLGMSTSLDTTVCGQEMTAESRSKDQATGECMDGTGACTGRVSF